MAKRPWEYEIDEKTSAAILEGCILSAMRTGDTVIQSAASRAMVEKQRRVDAGENAQLKARIAMLEKQLATIEPAKPCPLWQAGIAGVVAGAAVAGLILGIF